MNKSHKPFRFSFTQTSHSNIDCTDPGHYDKKGVTKIKKFKVKVRTRLIYCVEITFYEHLALIKFYPKIYETDPEKFKKVDIGLSTPEIRKFLNTCCEIINQQLKKESSFIFGFVGQWYEKDNEHNREVSKRFQLYFKQVALFYSTENYRHTEIKPFNFYCISKLDLVKHAEKLTASITFFAAELPEYVMGCCTKRVKEELFAKKLEFAGE